MEKQLAPSDGPVEAAVVAVELPRPRVKPAAAGCCGAVDVRTEPNDNPAGADEEVEAVVREKGVAEAVGLLKAKLNPVDAAVEAGAPNVRPVVGAAALEAGVLKENPVVGF